MVAILSAGVSLKVRLCSPLAAGYTLLVREVVKKSKWKFKMVFAMKGGGSRGGLECHIPIQKKNLKNHLESFPDC